jgi:predicted GTPase
MVKDMPGTTRDSVDTKFKYEDTNFVLIDTA